MGVERLILGWRLLTLLINKNAGISINKIIIEQGQCNEKMPAEKEEGKNRRKRCVVDGRLATHEASTTDITKSVPPVARVISEIARTLN